jgi:hypothetical protein
MGNFIIFTNIVMAKSKIVKACSALTRRIKLSKFLSYRIRAISSEYKDVDSTDSR